MTKGLEALQRLIGNRVFISFERINGKKQFANDINIIEKELEDYEYLKQSNEELQKLNTNYGKRIDKLEEILEILKRFIKSGESDLFGWCEQYDEVNNTNISKLIDEWLKR